MLVRINNHPSMYNHVMPDDLYELKKKLRSQCMDIRESLSADFRRNASLQICQHIRHWGKFQEAGVIFTYMPMNEEVDLLPLIAEFPQKKWVIPRIQPHSRMILHPYDPEKLIRHRFGMLEPDPSLPKVPPGQVDLVLAPGLAYDRQGWRLGYGGGFYDNFLADVPGLAALGVTYSALLMDDLPHNSHDIPVQALVTEKGIMDIYMEQKN
jgi:5-formyltetrahydrofolate cyclo-ligase